VIRKEPLLRAAMEVRAGAPVAWREFTTMLENYAADCAKQLVQTEPDRLVHMQGRAQAVQEIATLMTNAREELERLLERKDVSRSTARVS
jgi:hypothetical protein